MPFVILSYVFRRILLLFPAKNIFLNYISIKASTHFLFTFGKYNLVAMFIVWYLFRGWQIEAISQMRQKYHKAIFIANITVLFVWLWVRTSYGFVYGWSRWKWNPPWHSMVFGLAGGGVLEHAVLRASSALQTKLLRWHSSVPIPSSFNARPVTCLCACIELRVCRQLIYRVWEGDQQQYKCVFVVRCGWMDELLWYIQ